MSRERLSWQKAAFRWLVTDLQAWDALAARIRRETARPVLAAARVHQLVPDIAVEEWVRTQRPISVGARRIKSGALGRVIRRHAGRPLVEVLFADAPGSVTLASYELLAAGGAGSGNRTRASSLGS